MEEKEILLKTIEGLNASIASLSTTNKNQSEQIKNLQERIKELTAQVAFVHLVGDQFVGYLGLVQQTGCIGLIDLLHYILFYSYTFA